MIDTIHPGRGRGHQRSLEEAAALVHQWQASGLCRQAWCDQHGILRSTLVSCLRRTTPKGITTPSVSHPFIELQRRPPEAAPPRRIRLSLADAIATTELTIEDLGALILHLSQVRS